MFLKLFRFKIFKKIQKIIKVQVKELQRPALHEFNAAVELGERLSSIDIQDRESFEAEGKDREERQQEDIDEGI